MNISSASFSGKYSDYEIGFTSGFDVTAEGAIQTVFHGNVEIVIVLNDVVDRDHIVVLDCLESKHLIIEQILLQGSIQLTEGDNLDCNPSLGTVIEAYF